MKNVKEKIIATTITIILIILLTLFTGCSKYIYKSKPIRITHVLALTETGDTLKIPIDAIRPNVIYNVMGYQYGSSPYYRPYNYNNYNYDYGRIRPYNGGFSTSTITTTPPVKPVKPPSGTSGFTGQPKADNPSTRSGGVKKKNN
jgi:hypothetical protein